MTLSNEYQSTLPPSQGGSAASAPPSYSGGVTTGIPVSYTDAPQQPVLQIPLKPLGPWSTGLCDCFQDTSNCCMTFWCPCVTFGRIAEIVDKGATSCGASGALYTLIACLIGCACCYSCFYRSKMREQLRLKPSPCGDFLVHCFCESCALCQEYRELKNRGYNMIIGWQGNVERQNRGMEMEQVAPVVEVGMSR